jgi:Holliday junction resolvasome RuvABC endonuclease subunit
MKLTMGVDQSLTSTGIVLLQDGELKNETFALRITSNKDNNQYERVRQICDDFKDLLKQSKPDRLVFEGLAFGAKGNSVRVLAGVQFGMIVEALREGYIVNSNLFIVTPNAVKKFATGVGNSNKEAMFKALPLDVRETLLKVAKKTTGLFDLTDAYWIAKYKELK